MTDDIIYMGTPILDKKNKRIIYGTLDGKIIFRYAGDMRLYTDEGPTKYYLKGEE